MVNITKLKQLREETGISIALCKKALDESDDDFKKAKKLLDEWGIQKAEAKSDRATGDGAIFSYVHHNKKIASLVELLCETDFVSKNSDYQKLGQEIAMQVASLPAKNSSELMSQEYIRDSTRKISDLVKEAVLKFGENIRIGRFVRLRLGEE